MRAKPDGKSLFPEKNPPAEESALHRPDAKGRRDKLSEISLALRKDADMVCTDSIPDRLLDLIRKRIEAEKGKPKRARRMMTGPWVIRFALLALGLVFFLGIVLTAKKKESAPKPLRPDRTGAGPSYAEFIVRPVPKSRQYRAPDAFSSSISPLESSFRGEFFCVYDGFDGFRPAPPVFVFGRSEQLWTASSFQAPDLKEHLSELCKDLQIDERKITEKGNMLVLTARPNARQAAVLVKQLAAWGLIPVSRSGPLPDRYLYLGSGEKKMELVVTFLLRERQKGAGHLLREERTLFLRHGDPSGGGR